MHNPSRISIKKEEPVYFEFLLAIEKYIANTSLDPLLAELIKIRASQLNKCEYCIKMHSKAARKLGEKDSRIHALDSWATNSEFSDKEKASLLLTEAITLLSASGLSDEIYNTAVAQFTDQELAQIIIIINQINVWNRIAVSTKLYY